MRRTIFTTVLLAALVVTGLPAAARASRTQESLFQDDASLVYASAKRRDATLNELQRLGVDTIRANVVWNLYAPHPRSKKRPSFDATNPGAYPLGQVDALVQGAAAHGMSVLLTPTGPGPAWASACKGSVSTRRLCRPRPSEFARFVTALARRYPTVGRWSIWNEPNLGSWLTPQYVKRGGTWVVESARIYRGLVRAATDALASNGHGGDEILLGETAPIGRTSGPRYKRGAPPADFIRDLLCLDARGHKLRGRAARIRGCTSFQRLAVTGYAHHPYTRGAGQSLHSRVRSGDITLATIRRLSTWLDRGARQGRIPRGLPIWATEFGFQTNPPDRYAGTSLGNQARWLNESDWIAWRNPRIRTMGQYELRDERPLGAFQTGLRFASGKAKPGLAAYRLPIWPRASRSATKVWLQVRPASRVGVPQTVTVQYQSRGSKRWRTADTFTVTDPHGFLYVTVNRRAAYWRFSWNGMHSRKAAAS